MIQDMTHNMHKNIVRMTAMTARIVLTGLILLLTGGNARAGVVVTGSVYGGGNEAGVGANTVVNIETGSIATSGAEGAGVYGGCNTKGTVGGNATVVISGGTIGAGTVTDGVGTESKHANVHGGGKGQPTLVKGNVVVRIDKKNYTNEDKSGDAVIWGDVYGGSALGNVNAQNKGTDAQPNYDYSGDSEILVVKTAVSLISGTVYGSVYGGGLGQLKDADAGKDAIASDVYGPVTVTVEGGSATNVFGCNNLLGMPKQTVAVYIKGTKAVASGSYAISNVYGGGNQAKYDGTPTIEMSGGTVEEVYGGGYGASASVAGSSVTMKNGTGEGNTGGTASYIYGGGEEAPVTGSVVVNIQGGTVTNDVYGGGALADTNTANWDATNSKFLFFEVTGLTIGTSPVTGYYTKTGDVYTLTNDTKAKDETTYYSHYTTTVNLTGGTVGNAYGGALGSASKAADVWGDVYLTVNGTAFTISNDSYTEGTGDNVTTVQVPKTGRVFGCNNINGTPKREVTVHVVKTVEGSVKRTESTDLNSPDQSKHKYEIAAVYGGGNMAAYVPKKAETESTVDGDDYSSDDTKASTNVIIDGCSDTSIETVYGGGNAASTPSTKVTINGTYEIGELFGGGNGKDKLKNGDAWEDNPGAHVGFKAYTTESEKAAAKYGSGGKTLSGLCVSEVCG